MSNLTTEINNFVHSQVINGNCKNKVEAEKRIMGEIGAKEFLRSIEKSREQYRNGECEEMTDEWINNFIKKAEKRVLHNQS
jgi:hypothetical protein